MLRSSESFASNMVVTRILLISQFLVCLWVLSPACQVTRVCVPFTGLNNCSNLNNPNLEELKLPPIDNACCGPHCTYCALNGKPGACDDTNEKWRCLLDTHCLCNVTFIYRCMTDCELKRQNEQRFKEGRARYLSFNWTLATCEAQNKKCGLTCCCRETCPTHFCKIEKTTCP